MSLNALGLGFVFTARDLASGVMRRVGANFNVMSGQTSKGAAAIGSAAMAGAAGIGLLATAGVALGGALALANKAGEFQQGLAKVGALSGATAEELKLLSAAAKEAGMNTQFSPKEATEGLAELAAMGFNAQESIRLLTPALDLAAGGQISIAEASTVTASAMKVFGLNVDEGALAIDKLLMISNKTALQADDLQLAIGTVARGAIAATQSLDEMLPALGLVKNTGVDASVAASSVSSALQFMAKNASAFKGIGVEVTDAQGRFRPFLDVVMETEAALGKEFPNAADKAAAGMELFGRFGISAFTAITRQLETGITGANGQIVKGAEAVEFLRDSMRNAEGAAEEFKTRLLDTFEGQKTILKGIVETLAVVLGEEFASAFKPMVSGLSNMVTALIKFIERIPEPVKKAFAGFVMVFGVLTLGAGVILIVIAVVKALVVAGAALAACLGTIVLAVTAIVAVVGLVVAAWKGYTLATTEAERRTSVFARTWDKIKLAFTAVWALLSGSPVSKAVVDDLQKAENQGIFQFVQSIGRLIRRVKLFVDAVGTGFRSVMTGAGPVFDEFMKAIQELGEAFGFMGAGVNKAAGSPIENFIRAGVTVGRVIAKIVIFIVRVVSLIVRFFTGFVNGVKSAFALFEPVWAVLGALVRDVIDQFKKLITEIFPGIDKGAGGAGPIVSLLGKAFGFIGTILKFTVVPAIGFFLAALSVALRVWRVMTAIIKWALDKIIMPLFTKLKTFVLDVVVPAFLTMKDKVVGFFQPIIDAIKSLIDLLAEAITAIDEFFGIGDKAMEIAEGLANFVGYTMEGAPDAMSIETDDEPMPVQWADSFQGGANIPDATPTAEAAVAGASARRGSPTQLQLDYKRMADEMSRAGMSGEAIAKALKQNTLQVNIDGQRASDMLHQAKQDGSNREYRQVGVGD